MMKRKQRKPQKCVNKQHGTQGTNITTRVKGHTSKQESSASTAISRRNLSSNEQNTFDTEDLRTLPTDCDHSDETSTMQTRAPNSKDASLQRDTVKSDSQASLRSLRDLPALRRSSAATTCLVPDKVHLTKRKNPKEGIVENYSVYMTWTPEEKNSYWESIMKWMSTQYTAGTTVCLPRDKIFQHYLEYCKKNGLPAGPYLMLGKTLLKLFPRLVMRRLGTRGNSRYYYQGIDLLPENSHYTKISPERIISISGRPKQSKIIFKTKHGH